MAFDDPELMAQFVTESREHLGDIEGQFLQIEAGGQNADVNLVNTVFRSIHSIKGAAGFLGLTTVNKLAHSLENVLGKMRNNELTPTSFNVDVMLKAADKLNKLFDDIEASNNVDVNEHVQILDKIFEGESDEHAVAAGLAVSEPTHRGAASADSSAPTSTRGRAPPGGDAGGGPPPTERG